MTRVIIIIGFWKSIDEKMKKSVIIWFTTIIVLLALLWINSQFEFFALNFNGDKTKKDGSFRVMTYNVNATLGDEDIETLRTGLLREIQKHSPDILCLQELSSRISKAVLPTIDSLFVYKDSMSVKKKPSRYLIFSKKPVRNFKQISSILQSETLGLDLLKDELQKIKQGMPIFSAEIEAAPNKWITFYSVHLRSSAYSTARRSMREDASWLDGLPLYYENFKIGQKIRNWEADNLRLYLGSLEADDTPVIIAGDFNDWSGSYCMNTIRDEKYKDAWWEGGLGFGVTYDGWHLKLRLDHILYSHHFKLENVYVEKSKFSDHRPLVADFTLIDPH